jgi:hypothetical protein
MTSYLVESVLFVALLVTSLSVLQMYREIRRLRNDQTGFLATVAETSRMFEVLEGTLRDVRRDGVQVAARLEAGIDEGRTLIDQLETFRRNWTGPLAEQPAMRSGKQ